MDAFQKIVVVRNPVSTNAGRADSRIAELTATFPGCELAVIETVPGGREANRKALREHADLFGAETLLCIVAGDGTTGMIIEALLTDPVYSEEVRAMPVLPLWGGNANDLAHMLNGSPNRATMKKLIGNGKSVAVYPLQLKMTLPHRAMSSSIAACYISFGASAFAADRLGRTPTRNQGKLGAVPVVRFLRELIAVIGSLVNAPTFEVEEDGSHITVYEYVCFNGPRFAKVNGVKRPLGNRTFHRAVVKKKAFLSVAFSIAILANKRKAHELETQHAKFRTLSDTWAQLDGETLQLPAGSTVEIMVAPQPFYALATRQF